VRIGIDLGGTKIEGIGLDDEGRELARFRVPTPAGDYEGTVAAVAGLVTALERRTGGTGSVGVGIPGTLSPASGRVKNANSTWIIGRPLDHDLTAALGRPVRIANDANCFAVSEATDGAAAGAGVVFGVILGTGVGGGIVVHGRVLVGLNAIAGEWGHNPLPWPGADERPGAACYCGRHGCIETFLSGPALTRSFAEEAGRTVPPADIVALAAAGDDAAEAALARYEDRLARALASVINLLDPDVIVLGGGMSNVERLYRTVPRLWQDRVFSDRTDTPLVRNRHGDSSGVRGAAWLWPKESGPDTATAGT
jgi:fructokinase